MSKKNILFIFIFVMLMSLISCQNKDEPISDDPVTPVINEKQIVSITKSFNDSNLLLNYLYNDDSEKSVELSNENLTELYLDFLNYNKEEYLSIEDWNNLYLLKYENNDSRFEYQEVNDHEVTITKYIGSDTDIVIPTYYNDKYVTSLANKLFYQSKISNIVAPVYLKNIGPECFSFSTLESIEFLSNDITFKEKSFSYCFNLTRIILPKNQSSLPNEFCSYDNQLASICNLDNLKSIGPDAFFQCENLNNFTFSEKLISIGERAFYNCSAIKSVKIPTNIIRLESQTFFGLSNLTELELNNSLVYLGDECFYGLEKLESLNLPDSIEELDTGCFTSCTSIKEVIFPKNLKSIGSAVFLGCSSLEKVITNEGLENLGSTCFSKCTSLKTIELCSTMTHFGLDCFQGCTSLEEVNLPNNMRDVYDSSFNGCTSLVKVNIPESVKLIGGSAFYHCNLTEVVIPKACTYIWNNSFGRNNKLSKITIPFIGSQPYDDNTFSIIFGGSVPASLKEVTILDTCESLKANSFNGCSSIEYLYLPNSIKTINQNALTGLSNIKTIYYSGTKEEFNKIQIDVSNNDLLAKIVFVNNSL